MLLAGCEGITPELILKALPQLAVLVRGNWAVKSEVLFPKDTLSAVSGVPAEVMCRARDYVVSLHTFHSIVFTLKIVIGSFSYSQEISMSSDGRYPQLSKSRPKRLRRFSLVSLSCAIVKAGSWHYPQIRTLLQSMRIWYSDRMLFGTNVR